MHYVHSETVAMIKDSQGTLNIDFQTHGNSTVPFQGNAPFISTTKQTYVKSITKEPLDLRGDDIQVRLLRLKTYHKAWDQFICQI